MLIESEKIVIMCGGKGSRMGDITLDVPKPLIEINGKTVLEYKLDNYIGQGFDELIITLGYKKKKIEDLINSLDMKIKSKVKFSFVGEEAGILERLHYATKNINSPVIVTYGDTITNVNLKQLLKFHVGSKNEATIVVASIINPFGLVEFNSQNKVKSFKEKPSLNYFIGYFIINPEYVHNLDPNIISLPDSNGILKVFHDLIQKEKLGSYYYDGENITFNTPSELEIAKDEIINFFTLKERI